MSRSLTGRRGQYDVFTGQHRASTSSHACTPGRPLAAIKGDLADASRHTSPAISSPLLSASLAAISSPLLFPPDNLAASLLSDPMAERFPSNGAALNGFVRRSLHEDEARLLFEAEYPAPPDMWAPNSWRLRAGGVPVSPVPTGGKRHAEIARIRSMLSVEHRNQPRYAPDNNVLWTQYFERRRDEQLASTNGGPALGRNNSEGRRLWWGVPGRTLEAVLKHIEGGNEPCLGYPEAMSVSRRRGSSWQPRRMEASSSSSSSYSSGS